MPATLDVAVDLDGVVYDFVGSLRDWIVATTGRPSDELVPGTCWDFYRDDWGYSTAEFLAFCADGVNAGHIFAAGDPYPGSVEAINAIRDAGHRIHVVTARAFPNADADIIEASTRGWLDRVGLGFDTLRITSDKAISGLDLAVDDHGPNYEAFAAAGATPWLLDRPWNAHYDGRRVTTLDEFAARVDEAAASV